MSLAVVLLFAVLLIPTIGVLAVCLDSKRTPWAVATVSLGLTAVTSTLLATLLILDGATVYRLGIQGGPGLVFRSDALSVTVGLLDVVLTLGILGYTRTAGPHGREFYVPYLLFTTAVFGVVLSGDLLGIYAFLVLLIWATGRLVECSEKAGVEATARGYRRTATLGASVYLVGVLLAVWLGGSSDGQRLGFALAEVGYTDSLVVTSFVFMTVGLALLVALVPLHGWLIETHARATDPVSALISGVLPAAAVYAFFRVLFDVFTLEFLTANPAVTNGIIYGAIGSLLVGNLLAYGQRDIKGMLAYSTISQFGLIVAGLLVATETAVFGSVIQLFGHGIVKGAFCLVAGLIAIRFDARTIDEFGGLANRAPLVAAAFAGLAIAMIGLPPTVGFVGKWYIAVGALEQGLWVVTAFVVFSTLLTLGYVIPFVDRIYFGTFDGVDNGSQSITATMVAVVVLAALLSLAIGLASVTFEAFLREAIEGLVAAPVE
ncbi:proton-conducting transporter membrane subunit [Natronosalvus amylolyticus]|uniref:proton-conducting transporter transmembrane domain-containing protein n=1 Tax=Natronosalvus amylolyticus TaxID=2961994 RepID=UPI0020C978B8|nr:proton-conducting transporter membrane subunit [Natronosalvus amylolyticus]